MRHSLAAVFSPAVLSLAAWRHRCCLCDDGWRWYKVSEQSRANQRSFSVSLQLVDVSLWCRHPQRTLHIASDFVPANVYKAGRWSSQTLFPFRCNVLQSKADTAEEICVRPAAYGLQRVYESAVTGITGSRLHFSLHRKLTADTISCSLMLRNDVFFNKLRTKVSHIHTFKIKIGLMHQCINRMEGWYDPNTSDLLHSWG